MNTREEGLFFAAVSDIVTCLLVVSIQQETTALALLVTCGLAASPQTPKQLI